MIVPADSSKIVTTISAMVTMVTMVISHVWVVNSVVMFLTTSGHSCGGRVIKGEGGRADTEPVINKRHKNIENEEDWKILSLSSFS